MGKKMRSGTLIGLSVTIVGLALFIIASIPLTRVDEVINTAFVVNPGTKYGPYDAGTVYHTRVLTFSSALIGEVLVEGEGLYLSVQGYNTQNLRGVFVRGQKSFVIEPADDQYTFTFDNSAGMAASVVTFRLLEVWTASFSPAVWLLGLFGLLIMVPAGSVTVLVVHFRAPNARTPSGDRVSKSCRWSNSPTSTAVKMELLP